MRISSPWRLLLCVLLALQINAMALAQTMGQHQQPQNAASHPHCHEHMQPTDQSMVEHVPGDSHSHDTLLPDCCKSSHCHCQYVPTPALALSLPALAFPMPLAIASIEIATPHALVHVADPLRPPISSLS